MGFLAHGKTANWSGLMGRVELRFDFVNLSPSWVFAIFFPQGGVVAPVWGSPARAFGRD